MFSKMRAYVKSYDGKTNWMYFLIEHDDLLEKYSTIWDKVSSDINRESDSEPSYYKKGLKTKIKLYNDETAHFHNKEMPKAGTDHTCLAVITITSAFKKEENYYQYIFLEECKYIRKEVIRYITGDLQNFSDVSDEE